MSAPTLRISRSHFPVTVLGPGKRLGVWVQGCPLACRGCMSRDTWAADGGVEIGVGELAGRWREAIENGATGLTVSGGEPLAQPGPLLAFLQAADRVRTGFPGEYDILVFTGFELDELDEAQRRAVRYADVLVTGRYEAGQPTDLVWRGSANQRMLLRTELGRRRFAAHEEERATDPALQMRVDESGVWIIGVPRPGELARLDRGLRDAGLVADRVSWRPAAGSGRAERSDRDRAQRGGGDRS